LEVHSDHPDSFAVMTSPKKHKKEEKKIKETMNITITPLKNTPNESGIYMKG